MTSALATTTTHSTATRAGRTATASGQHDVPAVPVQATAPVLERPDARTLARWGFEVDLDGIAAHETEAQYVVKAATACGLRPILIQVLADTREPAVARARAFGRLALALAS